MNNKFLIFVTLVVIFLFFIFDSISVSNEAKSHSFDERVALLTYEKQLVCQVYDPCDQSVIDGRLSQNPQRALTACQTAKFYLPYVRTPDILDIKTKHKLDKVKLMLSKEIDSKIDAAEDLIKITQSSSGVAVNMGPSYNCKAYKALDRINKRYNIHRVMYDENERYYWYVHCGNLNSTEDMGSLLRTYDARTDLR